MVHHFTAENSVHGSNTQIPQVGAQMLTEAEGQGIKFPTLCACNLLLHETVIQVKVGNFLAHIVHTC